MKKYTYFFLLILVGFCNTIYSQNDSINLAFHHNFPQKQNIIKIGGYLLPLFSIGASLGYEKRFKGNIALDFNCKYWTSELTEADEWSDRYSISIGVKYYSTLQLNLMNKNYSLSLPFKNYYVGIFLKPVLAHYLGSDSYYGHYTSFDYWRFEIGPEIMVGKMFNVGNRFTIETGIGVIVTVYPILFVLPQMRFRIGIRY